MSIHDIDFYNKQLDRWTTLKVIVPDCPPPWPTLYLLHGRTGNAGDWLRFAPVYNILEPFPFLTILPDAELSFYLDSGLGRYGSFITQAIIPYIDQTFQTIPKREKRIICGLSMGGYGAMRTALANPHLFGGIASMSGVLDIMRWLDNPFLEERQEKDMLKNTVAPASANLFQLIDNFPAAQARPVISFDCGETDFLIEDNRKFHTYLTEKNWEHRYHEEPGEHSWDYWARNLPVNLRWLSAKLHIDCNNL